MNDGRSGLCLLLAGSLFFPLVYHSIKYFLTRLFKHKLNTGDICLISEKCTSSVQAIMSFVSGAVIVSKVDNIMYDTHWLSNSYAWFALPYFVHDIWAMYMSFYWNEGLQLHALPLKQRVKHFVDASVLMLGHHTIMPCIIFPAIIYFRRNLGDFFLGAFFMIEVTIPFISARAILVQLQLKNSPYYVVSGLLMLGSFFLSRVLVFPYLYWRYAVYAGLSLMEVPASIPVKCNLACAMILLPQLYWFWLMLRGAVRVFTKIYLRWNSQPHNA